MGSGGNIKTVSGSSAAAHHKNTIRLNEVNSPSRFLPPAGLCQGELRYGLGNTICLTCLHSSGGAQTLCACVCVDMLRAHGPPQSALLECHLHMEEACLHQRGRLTGTSAVPATDHTGGIAGIRPSLLFSRHPSPSASSKRR